MILSHEMLYFHRKNEIPFVMSKINLTNFKLCGEGIKKQTSQNISATSPKELKLDVARIFTLCFFFVPAPLILISTSYVTLRRKT